MSWQQLARAIADRYPNTVTDSLSSLQVVLLVPGDPPMRVGLRLRATTAYDQPVVIVAAEIGPADVIDPLTGLAVNAILAHGALAVADDVLELRTVLASDSQEPGGFELAVHRLAAEAAQLKRLLGLPAPARADVAAFAHHAD